MFRQKAINIWKRSIYFQLKNSQKSVKVIHERELLARCYQISSI